MDWRTKEHPDDAGAVNRDPAPLRIDGHGLTSVDEGDFLTFTQVANDDRWEAGTGWGNESEIRR